MSAETIPAEVRDIAREHARMSFQDPLSPIEDHISRAIMQALTDRSTHPAEPAAPVAEAGDGEVALKSLLAAIQLGHAACDADESSSDLSAFREAYGAHNAIEQLLANLRSTLEAERARADAAEQRAADALVRAENAADWQPIEAAPKGRVPFLALNYDGEIHVAAYDEHGRLMRRSHSAYRPQSFSIENGRKILISETEEWRNDWSLWTRLYEFKPTHWRPLPFLPRAAREAQPATDGGDNG